MTVGLIYDRVTCRFEAGAHDKAALESFSLTCARGEATCLLGPNGAGKSTALALAAGLLPPLDGAITVGGHTVGVLNPPASMGYLPQISTFPDVLTVGEVLDFSFRAGGTGVQARKATSLLFGLEPMLDHPVRTLSSGWVRRLGLAVALVPGTELLLLDEPFVGLDLEILDIVVDELDRRATEGMTVVLSSHDFEVVDRLRGRAAVMKEGRLAGEARLGAESSRRLYRRLLSVETADLEEREVALHAC